jgi:hypothetical protein
MGLDDRDYMRDVPVYRELVGRGGGVPATPAIAAHGYATPRPPRRLSSAARSRTRPWAWFLLGVIVVLAIIAFAAGRTHHAAQPAVYLQPSGVVLPRVPSVHTFHLTGPTRVAAGTFMVTSGTLPMNVDGIVVVEGRWRPSGWVTLGTTQSVNGGYRLRYQLAQPGTVDVRVALPDGDYAATVITVTPATGSASPSA